MYQEVFQKHADLLKAMSHPKRLEIINVLRDRELSVGELLDMMGLPQANLSQHLQVLRSVGVVTTRKDGKRIYYALAHKNFLKACDLMRHVLLAQYKDSPLSKQFAHAMPDLVPTVEDPVCGMHVSPKTAAVSERFDGKRFYFCAMGCGEKFRENPKKYIE